MKLYSLTVLALASGCGGSDDGDMPVDITELDGAWQVKYAGIADPTTPDDQLTETQTDPAYQITLTSGAGTERVTGMVSTTQCVCQHSVSLTWNDDGTGSITETANGTVVTGGATCDSFKNYSLFSAGANALQRVSYNGTRLVLMKEDTGDAFYAVMTR
jgi:hypothetical protein